MKIRRDYFAGKFATLEADVQQYVTTHPALGEKYKENYTFTAIGWAPKTVGVLYFNAFYLQSYQDLARIGKGYSIVTEPQMTIQIVPAAADAGTLDFLYTAVTTLASNTGVTIPLPADFCPYIKWGVLADMLKKDGPAHDMPRSAYCEMRFGEGVELAKILLRGF